MRKSQELVVMQQQAARITGFLSTHGISSQVTGGVRAPRVTTFELVVPDQVRLSSVSRLADDLARALGVLACRVGQRLDRLTIELAHNQAAKVSLSSLLEQVQEPPAASALLGMDLAGEVLGVQLNSPDVPHVLVAGTTGSGKTMLAQAMILSLSVFNSTSDLNLVLIDPKRRGYQVFEGLPNLAYSGVVYDPQVAHQVLVRLVELMEQRDRKGAHLPRIVAFIDELADLIQTEPGVEQSLTRLTQRGRAAGICVVACTQKPAAEVIGSIAKSNFPVRIVGRVASPEDAKVAAGIRQTGAEGLAGRGDFLLVHHGEVERFQAPFVSEDDIKATITRLRGRPCNVGATEDLRDSGVVEVAVSSVSKRDQVAALLRAGKTHRQAEIDVFGYAGGYANRVVKKVAAELGGATTSDESRVLDEARVS